MATARWLILAASVSSLLPRAAAAADPEPVDLWFGRDKAKHFAVSAGLAGGGYAAGAFVFESRSARAWTGAGVSLTAGLSKELYDWHRGGLFSWKDLSFDLLGTLTGLGTAYLVDRWVSPPPRRPE